jgi:hypothetical protein
MKKKYKPHPWWTQPKEKAKEAPPTLKKSEWWESKTGVYEGKK